MSLPILFTSPVLAWPPDQGSRRFLLETARSLQTLGPVTWLSRSIGPQDEARARLTAEGFQLCLDEDFVAQSWWARARRRSAIDIRAALRGVPREEEFSCTPTLLRLAQDWWRRHPQGLAVSAYWQTSRSLECAPLGRRVLIAPDVESQCLDIAAEKGATVASTSQRQKLRQAERRAYLRSNLLCLLTEEDRQAAEVLLGRSEETAPPTSLWPTVMPAVEGAKLRPVPDAQAPRLLIYGHWSAHFNRDGLSWFLNGIWPSLSQELPSATLRVVGSGLGSTPAHERIRYVGFVEDLESEILAADIVLIPLRYAGGMRYRLLEALAHARPVVCTAMAARGCGATAGLHYLEASNPREWAEALKSMTDPARSRSFGEQGAEWVARTHGTAHREARVRQALASVIEAKIEGDDDA
jgi:Glycosyl transferases group 1